MKQDDFARMQCGACAKRIKFPPTKIGHSVKCPACGTLLKLRDANATPSTTQRATVSEPAIGDKKGPFKFKPLHGVIGCFGASFLFVSGCLGCCLIIAPPSKPVDNVAAQTHEKGEPTEATPSRKTTAATVKPKVRKWYSGGTLHAKNGIDWQVADDANKLATCGDILTKCWVLSLIHISEPTRPY